MGLLNWWSKSKPQMILRGPERFRAELVGEQAFDANLIALSGSGAAKVCEGLLVVEDEAGPTGNRIRVEVAGQALGYLDEETADHYEGKVRQSGFTGLDAVDVYCNVKVGRRTESTAPGESSVGAWVDVPVDRE